MVVPAGKHRPKSMQVKNNETVEDKFVRKILEFLSDKRAIDKSCSFLVSQQVQIAQNRQHFLGNKSQKQELNNEIILYRALCQNIRIIGGFYQKIAKISHITFLC